MRKDSATRWPTIGFERLERLARSDIVETHFEAAKFGRTTGTGVTKSHYLDAIWAEYHQNILDRIDPIYTATRWVKHTVMHRPFADANRRTSFLWAGTHFSAFGRLIRVDTAEAKRFKESVNNTPFTEVYDWFVKELENAEKPATDA